MPPTLVLKTLGQNIIQDSLGKNHDARRKTRVREAGRKYNEERFCRMFYFSFSVKHTDLENIYKMMEIHYQDFYFHFNIRQGVFKLNISQGCSRIYFYDTTLRTKIYNDGVR